MRKILLLGSLLGLAACSRSSSHEKLVKSLQSVQSWTATAQMVGETWQQGNVPEAYAEQTLKKSQEEIARETKDLTESSVQQPV
jgi:Tfp pilus assembly protein PilP